MKNIILGMIGLFIAIYTLILGLNILTVVSHRNQLERNLSRIVKHILENEFQSENEEIVIRMLEEEIRSTVSRNIDMEIKVNQIDLQKGIISIEVREIVPNLMGTKREIVVSKTAIMEQQMTTYPMVTVTFWINNQIYKEYQLQKGERCPLPKEPVGDFRGWKEYESEYIISESDLEQVWENKSYEAVFGSQGGS